MDVNVLSEPTRPALDAKVVSWLSANEGDFARDSIILGGKRRVVSHLVWVMVSIRRRVAGRVPRLP